MPEPLRLPARPGQPEQAPEETPEVLVISAMLESGEFNPEVHGLTEDHLTCYEPLWRFAAEYHGKAGTAPPLNLITQKWPNFPFIPGLSLAWAVDQMHEAHQERELRRGLRAAQVALAQGDKGSAISTLAPVVNTPLRRTGPMGLDPFDISNVDDLSKRIGWSVPWPSLMRVTSGIVPGELWYIGARTGQGKSQVLPAMAVEAAEQGARVRYASLEMPAKQVNRRILRLYARHDPELRRRLFTGDVAQRRDAQTVLKSKVTGHIETVDPSMQRITTATVEDLARDVDLLFIDHVGLMSDSTGRRSIEDWRVAALISNVLKELAVSKTVAIVSAAQINREGDTNSNNPPKVSQLSQTDALGQDGDVIVTMKQLSKSVLVYEAGKVREGPNTKWWSRFDPDAGNFTEISKEAAMRQMLEDDDKID